MVLRAAVRCNIVFYSVMLIHPGNCYCGNAVAVAGNLSKQSTNSTCNTPCTGKKTECKKQNMLFLDRADLVDCGASSKISIFNTTTPNLNRYIKNIGGTYVHQGCFLDSSANPALRGESLSSGGLTVSACVDFCQSVNYKIAGIENGKQCYCGNSMKNFVQMPLADCKVTCSGNANAICGGVNRLSVYYEGTGSMPIGSSGTRRLRRAKLARAKRFVQTLFW